jgi:hypothetical protein
MGTTTATAIVPVWLSPWLAGFPAFCRVGDVIAAGDVDEDDGVVAGNVEVWWTVVVGGSLLVGSGVEDVGVLEVVVVDELDDVVVVVDEVVELLVVVDELELVMGRLVVVDELVLGGVAVGELVLAAELVVLGGSDVDEDEDEEDEDDGDDGDEVGDDEVGEV